MLTSRAVSVGTAVVRVAEAAGSPLIIDFHNNSGHVVYLGGPNVTSTTGFHLKQDENLHLSLYAGNEIYACTASNVATLICLEQQL